MVQLYNPFTPSEIAQNPEDFFGRSDELNLLSSSIPQGSVAIHGVVGIGKSLLLSRGLLLMEGFNSAHSATSVVAVADKGVATADAAARLVLESFLRVDESHKKIAFNLGKVFEYESAEICRNFVEGRHLAVLKQVVEETFNKKLLGKDKFLLIAIDEADKCPAPLAMMVRSICSHTQLKGVKRVRFLLAGVSPFFKKMVDEDPGVSRFFYHNFRLEPMSQDDATDLIETKLTKVVEDAEKKRISLTVDDGLIAKVVSLSGGHPHLLQLLGSHLVIHEEENPDGRIDAKDLVDSLSRICFEDRAAVYDSMWNTMDSYQRLEEFERLLAIADREFPTRIAKAKAIDAVGEEAISWFLDHQIIAKIDTGYGLTDEFLRIRTLLSAEENGDAQRKTERAIIRDVS
jgi:hypothetical protein